MHANIREPLSFLIKIIRKNEIILEILFPIWLHFSEFILFCILHLYKKFLCFFLFKFIAPGVLSLLSGYKQGRAVVRQQIYVDV